MIITHTVKPGYCLYFGSFMNYLKLVSSILTGLLFITGLCSCSGEKPKQLSGKYFGSYITNGTRRGRQYEDPKGNEYAFRYFQATITNDSLIPMHLDFTLEEKDYQLDTAKEEQFRVFVLPETMPPEKQFSAAFYDEAIKPFLDREPKRPVVLNKTLGPKEKYVITIGYLADTTLHLEPLRMVVFSKGHPHNTSAIPGSVVQQYRPVKNKLPLLLGLDFSLGGGIHSKGYAVIPCGQISYTDQ